MKRAAHLARTLVAWLLAAGCGATQAASDASSPAIAGRDSGGEAAGGGATLDSGGAPGAGEDGEAGLGSGETANSAGANGGDAAAGEGNAGAAGAARGDPQITLVPGVSERKRIRSRSDTSDWVLEEALLGFNQAQPPVTQVRRLGRGELSERIWQAPDGQYISDFCSHPSGELTLVLVSNTGVVSLVRLTGDLTLLGQGELHDPSVADDPHAAETGVTDLQAKSLIWDAARVGASGEAAFTVVTTSLNAVIGYRTHFAGDAWSAPERTLIEPPSALSPHLPIDGSFDVFGAMVAWFRAPLDFDEQGNAYVATWASPKRIRDHVAAFADALAPLPGDPAAPSAGDSDILLTKLDPDGRRLWTRVIGSEHEDEPYAVRAQGDLVVVVGRTRRFPGFDNTIWDGLITLTSMSERRTAVETVSSEDPTSCILLAIDTRPDGGWLLAGSDGWTQNPDGLSISSYGRKLLLDMPPSGETFRPSLPAGPRHGQINSVVGAAEGILFAGHEDGPVTHSGDEDAAEIHATGVLGFLPFEP